MHTYNHIKNIRQAITAKSPKTRNTNKVWHSFCRVIDKPKINCTMRQILHNYSKTSFLTNIIERDDGKKRKTLEEAQGMVAF